MKQQNFILIISSPSGAGKTSICKEILHLDSKFVPSVSVTTRPKRPQEVDSKDYYFITQEQFDFLKNHDQLLEHALVFDNHYGSPKQYIFEKLSEGYDVLFDIDWQGAKILKEKLGSLVISIFILPPSLLELKRRLRSRNQDSDTVIDDRMSKSCSEISHFDIYDYVLVNKDFDKTLARIFTIIEAERLRHVDFTKFVHDMMI